MVNLSKIKVNQQQRWFRFQDMLMSIDKPVFLHYRKHWYCRKTRIQTPEKLRKFITYGQRLELVKLFSETNERLLMIKILSCLYDLTPNQVARMRITEVSPFCIWVINEMRIILDNEYEKLNRPLTNIEIQAGFEKLAMFDHFPNEKYLMKEYSLSEKSVLSLKYSFVLVDLWYNKMHSECLEKYHELKVKAITP